MKDIISLLQWSFLGCPLYFGGGGGGRAPAPVAPPLPAPVAAPVRADSAGAEKKVKGHSRRRIGMMKALEGDLLGSLKKQSGLSSTLGGSASAYTGEG
jgi:hypothetical protein